MRTISLGALTLLVISSLCRGAAPSTTTAATWTKPAGTMRIVLAGDSTVTDKAGWGAAFIRRLDAGAECINLSRGGRSSMSFIKEGIWSNCLALKPNYVLIQFGHNDQKLEDPTRGTKPEEGYRQYMTQYIDDARAAGIKPIIVTSMSRRQFGDDGRIHSTLTPYVDVAKSIAKEKDLDVVDLHARSIELYEKLGKSGCETTIAPKKDDGSIDNTHLNAAGAELIAPLVIDELKRAAPELANHFVPASDVKQVRLPRPRSD